MENLNIDIEKEYVLFVGIWIRKLEIFEGFLFLKYMYVLEVLLFLNVFLYLGV